MIACPSKSSQEWKALVDTLGENDAYKSWLRNRGEAITPLEGAYQLFIDDNFEHATSTLSRALPWRDVELTKGMTSLELIRLAGDKLFEEPQFVAWANDKGLGEKLDLGKTQRWARMYNKVQIGNIIYRDQYDDTAMNYYELQLDDKVMRQTKADEIMLKMADRLSQNLGIPYEVVNKDQASSILASSKTPYADQAGFFFGGKAYFVSDQMTLDTTIHEFAHPLIRSIGMKNPELFENLYNGVKSAPEMQSLVDAVKALYPDLMEDSDRFKEELIVHALEHATVAKTTQQEVSNNLKAFINNLLFAIRQILRKAFGQNIKVEKMDVGTSLDELANLLTSSRFKIESELVSDDDIAAYREDVKKYMDDIAKVEDAEVVKIINRFFDVASRQMEVIRQNPKNFAQIRDSLVSQEGTGLLSNIKRQLSPYQTVTQKSEMEDSINELQDQLNRVQRQANALAVSTLTLKEITSKIITDLASINNSPEVESREALYKAFYYKYLLDYWKKFTEEAREGLTTAGVQGTSEIYSLLSNIDGLIGQGNRVVDNIYKKSLSNFLSEELWSMKEQMEALFKEREDLIHKNEKDPQKMETKLAELTAEYDKVKITKEKLASVLEGTEGDMNQLNAWLESYLNAQDPVIGSFSTFLKGEYSDVDNKALKNYNIMMKEVEPLLKKAGYNPAQLTKLWEKILTTDVIGVTGKDGKIEKKEVYTFLNPHKDYRYDLATMTDEWETAKGSGDREQMGKVAKKVRAMKADYFYQPYVQEFYDLQKIFDSPLGQEAWLERQELLEKMSLHSGTQFSELEENMNYDTNKALRREYEQLFNLNDIDGTPKAGRELEKVKILREYREKSRKFYEWNEREGAFETALNNFENQLEANGIARGSDEFHKSVEEWIGRNTRTVYDQSWYQARNKVLAQIKEILGKFDEKIQKDLDVTEAWTNILGIVSGFRDEDGQPIASDMTEKQISRVKSLQQEIADAQGKLAGYTGLTQEEYDELTTYYDRASAGKSLTETERARMNELSSAKNLLGLDEFEKAELFELFRKLSELQSKIPTDYYLDTINYWLGKMEEGSVDETNANDILSMENANRLMAKDKSFRAWFEQNHIKKMVYNKQTKQREEKWERLYVWSVIIPKDEQYIKKTTLNRTDPTTGAPVVVKGVPSIKYFYRKVKDDFRTPRVVGVTVDNLGGRDSWLPRAKEAITVKGVTLPAAKADSPYINDDYYALKKQSPELFELLEAIKKYHLKHQGNIIYGSSEEVPEGEGRAPRQSRLYLDLPRFRKSNLEYVQSGDMRKAGAAKLSKLGNIAKGFKQFFTKSADDYEQGMNFKPEDQYRLVRADMFDDELSSIPVEGLFKLERGQTSMDVLHSSLKYMLSLEKQKKLIEINPIAQALKQTLNNNQVKDMGAASKFHFQHRNELRFVNKRGRNVRAAAFNAMYNREFLGEKLTGFGSDSPGIMKTSNQLMRAASFGFFALNIPSALQNRWGAIFQNNIEAAAGRHMSPQSFALGRVWSFKAMSAYSGKQAYTRGPRSKEQQLIDAFDAVQGRFEEKFGDNVSRSLAKDTASMSFFFSPRKWMEVESSLQLFGGMMHYLYVEQKLPDGSTKQLRYMDAWEVDKNGQLVLKEGVDPEWDLGGKQFKAFRNRLHEAGNHLYGSMAKFDQPEAQRYLLFKIFSFMRRYFASMLINRFGFSTKNGNFGGYRFNWGLATMHRGFYVTSMAATVKLVKSMGKYWNYMTKDEKVAYRKVLTEFAQLYLIALVGSLIFGWDSDDPDRYAKLRAKSGPLGSDNFQLDGYLTNHMLNLMLRTRSENEQFIPLPSFGLDNYLQLKNSTSVMFGPTADTYGKMMYDLWRFVWDDDSEYYKKDVGPYAWQSQGQAKLWNHIGTALGVTGTSVDPVKAIKNFESVQSKYK